LREVVILRSEATKNLVVRISGPFMKKNEILRFTKPALSMVEGFRSG
jgi:hypothetical protein